MRIVKREGADCQLCGAAHEVRRIDWENKAMAAVVLCASCRAQLLAALAVAAAEESRRSEGAQGQAQTFSEAALAIQAEAAKMTEEAFAEQYLDDTIDGIIFEYIRGYGKADMEGEGCAMVLLMMDGTVSDQMVAEHLAALEARGIIYSVAGKAGWYGADYPFLDDCSELKSEK